MISALHPDVSSHSFRKTVATLIDDSGLSARIAAIGTRTGHTGQDPDALTDGLPTPMVIPWGRGSAKPVQHPTHLVAADSHTSPRGTAIGHVEKNPRQPAGDVLRVHRNVDGVVVDRTGVVEVFRD